MDKSIENLKEAVAKKNDKAHVHNNLGLSYFEIGDYPNAINSYSNAIKHDNAKSAVHFNNRGLANYHNNELDNAKIDFDEAIKRDPNDPTIVFNRGNVFLNWDKKDRFEKAHRDYDKAIELAPTNAKFWHAKGLAYESEAEELLAEKKEAGSELNNLAIQMYQ